MLGGDGDDVIEDTSAGQNLIRGGDGNDTLRAPSGEARMHGDAGADVLRGDGTFFGGAGDDSLYVDGEANGGAGDDLLLGGSGDDTLRGGDGNDHLRDTSGSNVIEGGAGDDSIDAFQGGSNRVLSGGDGNDTIYGFIADEVLGGDGDDLLNVASGNPRLAGGPGDDTLDGAGAGSSDTYVYADGDGADTVVDFEALWPQPDGPAGPRDQIELAVTGIDDFSDVLDVAREEDRPDGPPDIVLDFGNGDSLTLGRQSLSDLSADNFIFV